MDTTLDDLIVPDAELAARGLIRCPACGLVHNITAPPDVVCICNGCAYVYAMTEGLTPRPLTREEQTRVKTANAKCRKSVLRHVRKVVKPHWG